MDKFEIAYIDDVFIYLETKEEYHQYVKEVPRRFYQASYQIAVEKCELKIMRVKYLG